MRKCVVYKTPSVHVTSTFVGSHGHALDHHNALYVGLGVFQTLVILPMRVP